jgi:hypothetical protein
LFLPLEVVDAGATLLQLFYNVSVAHFNGDQGECSVFVQLVLVVQPHEVSQFFNEPVFVIPDWFPLFVLVLLVIVANVVEYPYTVISPDNLASSDQQLAYILLDPTMTPLNTFALLHALQSVY